MKSCTMKMDSDEHGTLFNDKTNLISYRESTQQIDLSAIIGKKAYADQLKNSMLLSSMPSFDKALDKSGGASARKTIT